MARGKDSLMIISRSRTIMVISISTSIKNNTINNSEKEEKGIIREKATTLITMYNILTSRPWSSPETKILSQNSRNFRSKPKPILKSKFKKIRIMITLNNTFTQVSHKSKTCNNHPHLFIHKIQNHSYYSITTSQHKIKPKHWHKIATY